MIDQSIWLVIPVVLIAIAIRITRQWYKKKKELEYREVVRNTSMRYHALLALNKQFYFVPLSPLYRAKIASSKQQYDRFCFYDLFYETVKANRKLIEASIRQAEHNASLYAEYCMKLAVLPALSSKALASELQVPFDKYSLCEKELCDAVTLCPVTDFSIVCKISYVSPQGRNAYQRDHAFFTADIYRAFAEIANDQKRDHAKERQRSAMTPGLRYKVMQRDGFRCTLCGRSTEADGVKLEVDHIKPVSTGGLTEMDNLRTLCMECNRGKSASYTQYGPN